MLIPKNKHDVQDVHNGLLGVLVTFSDCPFISPLPRVLTGIKLTLKSSRVETSFGSFLVAIDTKCPSEQLIAIHNKLSAGDQYGYVINLNYMKNEGLLVPLATEDKSSINFDRYPMAFRCYYYVSTASTVPPVNDQALSASHYNNLKRAKLDRHSSHIFHLRNLNNWVKTILIAQACRRMSTEGLEGVDKGLRVMDIACGKGGDIMKWYKNPYGLTKYIGVDIAKGSLEDFATRLQTFGPSVSRCVSMLLCGDMGDMSLPRRGTLSASYNTFIPVTNMWHTSTPNDLSCDDYPEQLHIVSCQFALHYIFESEIRCRHFFSQVSSSLNDGGYFIATTVDCSALVELLVEAMTFEQQAGSENAVTVAINQNGDCVNANASQHSTDIILCRISFSQSAANKLLAAHMQSSDTSTYGIKYKFELFDDTTRMHDMSTSAAVDAPEWVVPFSSEVRTLFRECNLEIVYEKNFHQFTHENTTDSSASSLAETMSVYNIHGTMSKAEWRIAGLYKVILLRKASLAKVNYAASSTPATHISRFAPMSPDGPLPVSVASGVAGASRFAPTSPDGPPPVSVTSGVAGASRFAPMSPDSPPPASVTSGVAGASRFAPMSPDGPPPASVASGVAGASRFAPTSPDGPLPVSVASGAASASRFAPTSRDGPPPVSVASGVASASRFAPMSPDGPLPVLVASGVTGASRFAPTSPDGPLPVSVASGVASASRFAPTSPDGPPPVSVASGVAGASRFAPTSPDGPPPVSDASRFDPTNSDGAPLLVHDLTSSDSDGEDDSMLLLLSVRSKAIDLCGGINVWNSLSTTQAESFIQMAREFF